MFVASITISGYIGSGREYVKYVTHSHQRTVEAGGMLLQL